MNKLKLKVPGDTEGMKRTIGINELFFKQINIGMNEWMNQQ